MSTALDQRIDALLGDVATEDADCPVFLEMSEATASAVIESLRWALYGGRQPDYGRKALLVVMDALVLAISTSHTQSCSHPDTQSCSPSDPQPTGRTLAL